VPAGLPVFRFPEEAARALGRVAGWAEWRRRPVEEPWRPDRARHDDATAVIADALARGDGWLRPEEVAALLDCYGIAQAPARLVSSVRRAEIAAAELGGRVVLKAMGPDVLHKTELGAVALGLHGARQVGSAARRMRDRLEKAGRHVDGFLVQRMIEDGVELLVGITTDAAMGPVVACGAGGTATELLGDVQVALPPLSWAEGERMLRRLRVYPLLQGFRGASGVDVDSVREVLLRVGALAEDVPEIAELDLNPVLATPDGAFVADARVRAVARGPAVPDDARPRMRMG
jgi:acyl-CoA synthetase (NDP forming)